MKSKKVNIIDLFPVLREAKKFICSNQSTCEVKIILEQVFLKLLPKFCLAERNLNNGGQKLVPEPFSDLASIYLDAWASITCLKESISIPESTSEISSDVKLHCALYLSLDQ